MLWAMGPIPQTWGWGLGWSLIMMCFQLWEKKAEAGEKNSLYYTDRGFSAQHYASGCYLLLSKKPSPATFTL